MYNVNLKFNNIVLPIHDEINKLSKGNVKQGINTIDSFSFEILPSNQGFNYVHEFKTLISVWNEKRNKYEFQGRVLKSTPKMDSSGMITKNVVCESFLGYLQDTEQDYVQEKNWTPKELLTFLINKHNSLVESYKQFKIGTVEYDDNIYIGVQRESTWDCIQKKLIEKLNCEIELEVNENGMFLHLFEERGQKTTTSIELSKNMISIKKDTDPSTYITRLFPLGAKLTDAEGNSIEERLDISSVNDGVKYIDDEIAIANYGIIAKHQYWDDVHDASILKTKAINFLAENNKVLQKYVINAVDLAILGLDIQYIDCCNWYKVKNKLLNIDEELRVISKSINVCDISKTSFEIGDNFKSLIDIELEKESLIGSTVQKIEKVESNYVTNQKIASVEQDLYTAINQNSTKIESVVAETTTVISEFEEYKETVQTSFEQTNDSFNMTFTELLQKITNIDGTVNSNYNELVKYIRFKDGTITLGEEGNPLTLTLSNDRLSFKQNGVEIAYISESKMYIYDGEFLNSLKIGRWVFIPRTNGNLSFTYV